LEDEAQHIRDAIAGLGSVSPPAEEDWTGGRRVGEASDEKPDGADGWGGGRRTDTSVNDTSELSGRALASCDFSRAQELVQALEAMGPTARAEAVRRRRELGAAIAKREALQIDLSRLAAVLPSANAAQIRAAIDPVLANAECPEDLARIRDAISRTRQALEDQVAANEASMRSAIQSSKARQQRNAQAWSDIAGTLTTLAGELERANAVSRQSSAGVGAPPGTSAGGVPSPATGSVAGGGAPSGGGDTSDAALPTCLVEREALTITAQAGQVYYLLESSQVQQGHSFRAYAIRAVDPDFPRRSGWLGPFDSPNEARAELDRRCPPSERAVGSIRF